MDSISFFIQGDSEGFIKFECPFCKSDFKLQANEYQNDGTTINLFCPYCGLTSEKEDFYPEEILKQIEILITNYYHEELNKMFAGMAKSINSEGKGMVKIDYQPLKNANLPELKDKYTVEKELCCLSCRKEEKVLYLAGISKVYCAYCGVDLP